MVSIPLKWLDLFKKFPKSQISICQLTAQPQELAWQLLPKWSSDLKYGQCPPARDWGSPVSGLVFCFTILQELMSQVSERPGDSSKLESEWANWWVKQASDARKVKQSTVEQVSGASEQCERTIKASD